MQSYVRNVTANHTLLPRILRECCHLESLRILWHDFIRAEALV